MSLLQGVLFSIIGNISTGTSQVLQKRALRRLQEKQVDADFLYRLTDVEWILGIILSILGDFLNFIAFSKTNPALLMPLGIISIMTALVLSQKYLNESISYRQKKGYGFVLCGVVILLLCSPSNDRDIGQSVRSLFAVVLSEKFILGILILSCFQALLIYGFFRAKIVSLVLNVCICSVFGGLNITLGRVISLYFGIISSSIDKDLVGPVDYVPAKLLQAVFVFFVATSVLVCTIWQEYFKQKSLDNFPVSLFFPTMFAGLNSVVIIASVYFWSEFESSTQFRIFGILFTIAIAFIIFGIAYVVRNTKVAKIEVAVPEIKQF